jgi:hypothetical protein
VSLSCWYQLARAVVRTGKYPTACSLDITYHAIEDAIEATRVLYEYIPNIHTIFLPSCVIMSSGLEIKSSKLQESWEGKRLWLNLVSLGLAGFFTSIGSGQKQHSADGGSARGPSTGDTPKLASRSTDGRSSFTFAGASVLSASKRFNNRYDDDSDDDEDETAEMESRCQKEAADRHLAVHRHNWIKHMSLMDDMKSEHPDIEVRAMEGLAGVDYLTDAWRTYQSFIVRIRPSHCCLEGGWISGGGQSGCVPV